MRDKRYLNCKYLDAGMDGVLCSNEGLCATCKEFKGEKCSYYTPKNKMKDKEKQFETDTNDGYKEIEEMAKELEKDINTPMYSYHYLASKLQPKGWIKLPKDKVVLSREAWEEKLEASKRVIDLSHEITKTHREAIQEAKDQARKETAEKLLSELYYIARFYYGDSANVLAWAKDKAKQIGVEVEG